MRKVWRFVVEVVFTALWYWRGYRDEMARMREKGTGHR